MDQPVSIYKILGNKKKLVNNITRENHDLSDFYPTIFILWDIDLFLNYIRLPERSFKSCSSPPLLLLMQRQKPNTWVQLFMTRSLYIWLSCILIWGVQDQLIFPNIFSVVGCGGLWVFLPQSKWSDIFHRKEPHKQLRQKENKAASEDCKYRDWYQTKTMDWTGVCLLQWQVERKARPSHLTAEWSTLIGRDPRDTVLWLVEPYFAGAKVYAITTHDKWLMHEKRHPYAIKTRRKAKNALSCPYGIRELASVISESLNLFRVLDFVSERQTDEERSLVHL